MISIKSEDFSANYELFAKLCEITAEPLKITKEGQADLVIMNAEAFERRRKMLDLRERLIRKGEDDEALSSKGISLEELGKYIEETEDTSD